MCLKCDCMRTCPPRFSQQWRERYSAPPDKRTKKRRCANTTFDFGGLAAFSPLMGYNIRMRTSLMWWRYPFFLRVVLCPDRYTPANRDRLDCQNTLRSLKSRG